jgi:hypothetical protein
MTVISQATPSSALVAPTNLSPYLPPAIPQRHPSHTSASIISKISGNSESVRGHSPLPSQSSIAHRPPSSSFSGDTLRGSPIHGYATPISRHHSLASAVSDAAISPSSVVPDPMTTLAEGPYELDAMPEVKELSVGRARNLFVVNPDIPIDFSFESKHNNAKLSQDDTASAKTEQVRILEERIKALEARVQTLSGTQSAT